MNPATTPEDLEPLLQLCRAGKLFEVQKWIKQGKPVALADGAQSRGARRNPLRLAMESGFHSLVQVLLEAGAPQRQGHYHALDHAVMLRRHDLASLLFQHGAKVHDVSMRLVIEMWRPEMVELFLANGASLVRDNPLAWGLVHKIRPALGLLKRFAGELPDLMKQADIALRVHARDGNAKWVALLLWAGANPCSRGPDRPDNLPDDDGEEGGLTAIELAPIAGKLDILKQKKMLPVPDPSRPETLGLLQDACHAPDSQALSFLLERGHTPQHLADRGTAAISSLLNSMSWEYSSDHHGTWSDSRARSGIDSSRARERMKMVHMLVARGAKWLPTDKRAIGHVRQYLLKMAPSYIVEFVWVLKTYGAARRSDVRDLLRTPAMARVLSQERDRVTAIVASIPEECLDQ